MYEDTSPKMLLGELLPQIENRMSALPEFQRDFVWDPAATKELIVSVAREFPAGSILRIRNTHNLFACREIKGAPQLGEGRADYLVLDGQQRLTSLYQAFYGKGETLYFLNVQKLLDSEDFEECVLAIKANRPQARRYSDITNQAAELVMPLSVLSKDGGFSRWVLEVSHRRHSDDAQKMMDMQDRLNTGVLKPWIEIIQRYQFPVVTLSDSVHAEAVCTIFETLNRTGVKLTAFDLLTARFWPHGINLREDWETAQQEHPILDDMEVDPYYLLQAVSLCARTTPGCKRSEVLALGRDAYTEWWPRIARGYADALDILQSECGVLAPKWLPYAAMPIPMAAMLAKTASVIGPSVGGNRGKLIRWYWRSVLNRTYDNPPNSQAAKDFTELQRWFNGGEEPEAVTNFDVNQIGRLHDVTFRQRALYRGLVGLVLRNGPKDFHSGRRINAVKMDGRTIDDHHIFPDGWLRDNGYGNGAGDCILNRTLIDSETNRRIGKKAPSIYIPDIENALTSATSMQDLLASHYCSIDALKSDDFHRFIKEREGQIWNAIREVTQ